MTIPRHDLNDLILSKFQNTPNSNLSVKALIEHALQRNEGKLTCNGVLTARTGSKTGRSPRDKFIVRDAMTHDSVWWDNAGALSVQQFDTLFADMMEHVSNRPMFVQDLAAGACQEHRIGVKAITELAWHALFMRNLLIRPELEALKNFASQLTVIDIPSFKADPARHGCRSETVIACDFTRRIVLIAGTQYAGEMKKAVFTYLNFILPVHGVLPMHCAANVGTEGDVAIFFGLSGTGKTTLSADARRSLIGDDEHGWSQDGVFNFEGGCYAKTIRLSAANAPQIYAATQHVETVLENVVIDNTTGQPDFDDGSLTENARAAYPIHVVSNASASGFAGHPRNVFLLTCDAFGVLPPIARLTPDQAMNLFLMGYTSKVAGTEQGVSEPQTTFSACFGAPFMPRPPQVYGGLLKTYLAQQNAACWLLNTGWTTGPCGIGMRIPLKVTRTILDAVLDGTVSKGSFRRDENFGYDVPNSFPGITDRVLTPRLTWQDELSHDAMVNRLLDLFHQHRAEIAAS